MYTANGTYIYFRRLIEPRSRTLKSMAYCVYPSYLRFFLEWILITFNVEHCYMCKWYYRLDVMHTVNRFLFWNKTFQTSLRSLEEIAYNCCYNVHTDTGHNKWIKIYFGFSKFQFQLLAIPALLADIVAALAGIRPRYSLWYEFSGEGTLKIDWVIMAIRNIHYSALRFIPCVIPL